MQSDYLKEEIKLLDSSSGAGFFTPLYTKAYRVRLTLTAMTSELLQETTHLEQVNITWIIEKDRKQIATGIITNDIDVPVQHGQTSFYVFPDCDFGDLDCSAVRLRKNIRYKLRWTVEGGTGALNILNPRIGIYRIRFKYDNFWRYWLLSHNPLWWIGASMLFITTGFMVQLKK